MDLQAKPYTNLDSVGQIGIARAIDTAKDDAMNNTRRPGLGSDTANAYQIDLGENKQVDTLYEWDRQNWMVAVCNGKIFKIVKVSSNYVVTEITGATLAIGTPVTFADFGDTLFLANGGQIIKWSAINTTCAYIADGDAPTSVTHIGFIDHYLIALDNDTNLVNFANVADPDNWDGEFFDAERLPDKTIAMHTGFGEIIPFASMSIEYVGNTGNATIPFQRYEGKVTQRGTIAPYSIQQIDNTYFFLDEERKITRLVGADPQVISNPFDADFQALNTIEDARSMHVKCGGDTFYVISFPSELKTYAYDYKRDSFFEWSYMNATSGNRENFLGLTSCYIKRWNQHFVGSRLADGYIYLSSKEIYQDGGASCQFELITGWEGNGDWRVVKELLLKLKRGTGAAITKPEPFLDVYYRNSDANPNDSDASWKGPRSVNLGQLGESNHLARITQLGRYRNRQYRFVCSGNVPVVLVAAEEVYG